MSKGNVIELAGRDDNQDSLTDMLRAGAHQLIQQAVEAVSSGEMGSALEVLVGPQAKGQAGTSQ